ncbi:hypothetical protein [Paenibacillus sp. YIM B09110]|uniref:hypothetical protein n=1 Tax=Paenibacillus sp. YIM B09110 TaxID=3126102 RepID=UPI00301B88B4
MLIDSVEKSSSRKNGLTDTVISCIFTLVIKSVEASQRISLKAYKRCSANDEDVTKEKSYKIIGVIQDDRHY